MLFTTLASASVVDKVMYEVIHSGLISAATKNFITTDFTKFATFEVTTSDEHAVCFGEIGEPRNEGVLWRAVDGRHADLLRSMLLCFISSCLLTTSLASLAMMKPERTVVLVTVLMEGPSLPSSRGLRISYRASSGCPNNIRPSAM